MKAMFNIKRSLRAIIKKKIIIIIVFILSIGIGFAFNYVTKENVYKATANVYCDAMNVLVEGRPVVQNYSDVIVSKRVADRAAIIFNNEKYNGDMIKNKVSCSFLKDSPVYKIHVTSNNQEEAIEMANAVATAFVMEINILTNCNAEVLDRAYEAKMIFNGRKEQIKNITLFALMGIVLCNLLIIILAGTSKKVETVDDVTLGGEIEILGIIPNFDVE